MLIRKIKLQNLLSFGPDAERSFGADGWLEMKPLNVLIGANGSGKSNLIEAISLLKAAPVDLAGAISQGGGVAEWIWKGEPKPAFASIDAILESPAGSPPLHCRLAFAEKNRKLAVIDQRVELADSNKNISELDEVPTDRQAVAEPSPYDEHLASTFEQIRIYRNFPVGFCSPQPCQQAADQPQEFLNEDCGNLGLVLKHITQNPKSKTKMLEALHKIYDGLTDIDVHIVDGNAQVMMLEGDIAIPASRLSDGTMRYISLLAILCHPNPPSLVCIEVPELCIHPDIIANIAEMMEDAMEQCQYIITTHSNVLIDAFSEMSESVVVFEKYQGQTEARRLDPEYLADELEESTLGQLWSEGGIGGNRW